MLIQFRWCCRRHVDSNWAWISQFVCLVWNSHRREFSSAPQDSVQSTGDLTATTRPNRLARRNLAPNRHSYVWHDLGEVLAIVGLWPRVFRRQHRSIDLTCSIGPKKKTDSIEMCALCWMCSKRTLSGSFDWAIDLDWLIWTNWVKKSLLKI